MTVDAKTIRRRQLRRRVQKGIANTMQAIGQTFDTDRRHTRVITDADKRVATNRAFGEVREAERDADTIEMAIEDAARRLALGLGEEDELMAELEELDAELLRVRRRARYFSIAARVLSDERGVIRDSAGNILR